MQLPQLCLVFVLPQPRTELKLLQKEINLWNIAIYLKIASSVSGLELGSDCFFLFLFLIGSSEECVQIRETPKSKAQRCNKVHAKKTCRPKQENRRKRKGAKNKPLTPSPYFELIHSTKPIMAMGDSSTCNLIHSKKCS